MVVCKLSRVETDQNLARETCLPPRGLITNYLRAIAWREAMKYQRYLGLAHYSNLTRSCQYKVPTSNSNSNNLPNNSLFLRYPQMLPTIIMLIIHKGKSWCGIFKTSRSWKFSKRYSHVNHSSCSQHQLSSMTWHLRLVIAIWEVANFRASNSCKCKLLKVDLDHLLQA